jgi:hypothetical protein
MPPAGELTGETRKSNPPFSIETGIETEIRPYVGVSAVFLYWYLRIVSISVTNDSEEPHTAITVRLAGSPGVPECEAIEETFVIPFLGPHDTDTRVFRYQQKMDCPYDLKGQIVSYR